MKIDNLIKLKTWKMEKDNNGSEYKILDNKLIAVELKTAPVKNNQLIFNNIKIVLNKNKINEYIKIPKCREFEVTYKTEGFSPLIFNIEENMTIYNYYYNLPPAKKWTTKIIKISKMKKTGKNNAKLNLNKITGFIFKINPNKNEEITNVIYIKEFVIKGYNAVTIKNKNGIGSANLLFKKSLINKIKISNLLKKEQVKLFDSKGNPLYCIEPFINLYINMDFISSCCFMYLEENINFNKNKNLIDVWQGDELEMIRLRVKNFNYLKCDLKRCTSYNTKKESFQNIKTIRKKYPEIADYLDGKTNKFKGFPGSIFAGFDSTCNLTCRSCNADKLKNQSKEIGNEYIKQIENLGKNVEKLLISCYGDPFASPIYKNWIFNFSDKKFPKLKTIEIMTNGILWTPENWEKISYDIKKHNVTGIISIDGSQKETYEYNRSNAKFEKLIENLKFISGLRQKKELKSLVLHFVVQKNNYKEMPSMIDFARKYSFDKIIFLKITNWGIENYKNEDFKNINVFDCNHPEHKIFKKICNKLKKIKLKDIRIDLSFKL